jgi:hypothetical protein
MIPLKPKLTDEQKAERKAKQRKRRISELREMMRIDVENLRKIIYGPNYAKR